MYSSVVAVAFSLVKKLGIDRTQSISMMTMRVYRIASDVSQAHYSIQHLFNSEFSQPRVLYTPQFWNEAEATLECSRLVMPADTGTFYLSLGDILVIRAQYIVKKRIHSFQLFTTHI